MPNAVPIAMASALIAMLNAKPFASSGVQRQTASAIDALSAPACACA